ncbi:GNAT family N-acetyltransferase [Dietzia lutea]|uniref:N-acetyltransferase domain-containing protein n=1 Tax=Dietzia lutea TaxID=546160 RepID=A0A2S1R578_9ACTN|nr:GNAT family N-acetyltransferase [Dietzia lutea]AWH91404.1 hypothetical protein A6035_03560 [Dietzia lutea]
MSDVIEMAASRRREIFAAVSSAAGPDDAVGAIASLLSVSADEARQVLKAPLEAFTGSATGAPAGDVGQGFALRPFTESEDHTALYHSRSSDETSATGGTWDREKTEQELRDGLDRVEAESAMWFVAVDTARDALVGLVFGEQIDEGDVDVAIWIRPEERKKGYGMAALKESRRELAAFFPGKHVIVRAPLAGSR